MSISISKTLIGDIYEDAAMARTITGSTWINLYRIFPSDMGITGNWPARTFKVLVKASTPYTDQLELHIKLTNQLGELICENAFNLNEDLLTSASFQIPALPNTDARYVDVAIFGKNASTQSVYLSACGFVVDNLTGPAFPFIPRS